MDTFWFELIGIVLLIVLVAFFSASEVAVVSTRKSRLKELADEGNRNAAAVLAFKNNPDQFLATVHVGVVLSLIIASGIGGIVGIQYLVPAIEACPIGWISKASNWFSLGIIVITIGFLVVVFGELVPKSLALRYAETVALSTARPMGVFEKAFRYPAKIVTLASTVFLLPFRKRPAPAGSGISAEEFKLMLEEGTKTGTISKTEHELIKSIFEFTDTTAKEVMIPRPDIVALDIDMPRERLLKVVLEEGYSRMPVYRESIDNIVGIVYSKDLLGLMEYRDLIILQDAIRPAFFVPETMKISRLMRELQRQKMHLAIVVDEFGGTAGIITMEDILEEIVGEIHDEYDEEVKDIEQAADGSFLVNGRVAIGDFNERFQAELPQADEYETVSGFLHTLSGRIPELNEDIAHEPFVFTIVKKSQRRIRLVRVRRTANPAAAGSGIARTRSGE